MHILTFSHKFWLNCFFIFLIVYFLLKCVGCYFISKHVIYFSVKMAIFYTGGILQRLDTDVHSTVTAKTSTAL